MFEIDYWLCCWRYAASRGCPAARPPPRWTATAFTASRRRTFRGDPIAGICITSLPDKKVGSVMLGSRVLVPGDVLTAEQPAQMTFSPRLTDLDESAEVGYLPIYPAAWRRPPP